MFTKSVIKFKKIHSPQIFLANWIKKVDLLKKYYLLSTIWKKKLLSVFSLIKFLYYCKFHKYHLILVKNVPTNYWLMTKRLKKRKNLTFLILKIFFFSPTSVYQTPRELRIWNEWYNYIPDSNTFISLVKKYMKRLFNRCHFITFAQNYLKRNDSIFNPLSYFPRNSRVHII